MPLIVGSGGGGTTDQTARDAAAAAQTSANTAQTSANTAQNEVNALEGLFAGEAVFQPPLGWYFAGQWYGLNKVGNVASSQSLQSGQIKFYPFVLTETVIISELGLHVITAAVTGTEARALIYSADPTTRQPNAKLASALIAGLGTTGGKNTLLGANLTLSAYTRYWAAVHMGCDAVVAGVADPSAVHGGYGTLATTSSLKSYQQPLAYTAGSDTAPASATLVAGDRLTTSMPELRFRIAL